jgi:hypothetical protein
VGQPLLQKGDERGINDAGCLLRGRMAGPRHQHERSPLELGGHPAADRRRDPTVSTSPDHERRLDHAPEPAHKIIEVELLERTAQRTTVVGVWHRSVILIEILSGDFGRVRVGGPQHSSGGRPGAQRCGEGAEQRPARDPERERPSGAESGSVNQDKPAHPVRRRQGDGGRDRAPHGVSDEHRVGDVQRIEQRQSEPRISGVVVTPPPLRLV